LIKYNKSERFRGVIQLFVGLWNDNGCGYFEMRWPMT